LHSAAGRRDLSATFHATVPTNPIARFTVGAVDGIAIRFRAASVTETIKPAEYYGRKGFFSLNVQVVCDGMCRFVYATTAAPGSMHDSAGCGQSRLARKIDSG